MLTKDLILLELYDNYCLRAKDIKERLNTSISTTLTRLRKDKLIERDTVDYQKVNYNITEDGRDYVMKSIRIRILEALSRTNKMKSKELKVKINGGVSPLLSRMRRDKQIKRNINPDNGNDITYSITETGFKVLKEFKEM
jgi:DNA-binding HxlR family transcriptional regulator